jgi:hypothetical protein
MELYSIIHLEIWKLKIVIDHFVPTTHKSKDNIEEDKTIFIKDTHREYSGLRVHVLTGDPAKTFSLQIPTNLHVQCRFVVICTSTSTITCSTSWPYYRQVLRYYKVYRLPVGEYGYKQYMYNSTSSSNRYHFETAVVVVVLMLTQINFQKN